VNLPLLPNAIEEVAVPAFLSPSRVADMLRCKLSVLASDVPGELPESVVADLGASMHHVVGEVSEGRWRTANTAAAAFAEILAAALLMFASTPTPLRVAVGRQLWAARIFRARGWALQDAPLASIGNTQPLRSDIRSEGPSDARVDTGSEAWIVWPSRRLRGRADRVQRVGARLRILENKSGQVFDQHGELLEGIGLQVGLYALAAEAIAGLEAEPVVRGAQTVVIPWDDKARQRVTAVLEELLAALPAGAPLSASAVASAGPHCRGCRLRSVCTTYLNDAPQMWLDAASSGRMPLDTWGEIIRTSDTAADVRLELRDAANRFVVVSGLSHDWDIQSLKAGDKVHLFNLETDQDRQHAERVQPANFREKTNASSSHSAFQLKVFRH